ncbi:Mlp family lipoprotein [Borrelia hermsii]|uniref:Mlp lipoprotein family protein n=1 Tax=Borrelia hermsii MTW TaxID=1313291 RepID=W5T4Z1_BORHE|nr:Mlp family lipoprotein [Borrelia hermsii]AHH14405.1 Mlp lipoprotein family protein [Borrelia hermsii MTW]
MSKINFILVLLLLISNCGQDNNKDKEIKSRNKRNSGEATQEVQKTPEEALREKLTEEQKKGLNFLKDALGDDNKLNEILKQDESKVKGSLEHINTEAKKCNGNDEGKSTFKTLVKAYFGGGIENKLDQFKENAISACGAGAGD